MSDDWFPTIYILCHSEKEKDRYEFLKKHIPSKGVPESKINFVKGIWGDNIKNEMYFHVYDPFRPHFSLEKHLTFKAAALSKGEVSLIITFFEAVVHACMYQTDEWILFLESDCFLRKDFVKRLSHIIHDEKAKTADYISLGEGVGTRPVNFLDSYYGETKLYDPPPPGKWVFRCTDSMLLRRSFLNKIRNTLVPFRECLDWEMNLQLGIHNGKALWADPPIVEQGTCRSRMKTLLPS